MTDDDAKAGFESDDRGNDLDPEVEGGDRTPCDDDYVLSDMDKDDEDADCDAEPPAPCEALVVPSPVDDFDDRGEGDHVAPGKGLGERQAFACGMLGCLSGACLSACVHTTCIQ
jgi:hypothetical protein